MTEEEVDLALTTIIKDWVASKSLPDDFGFRLRNSVHRSRRLYRLRVAALIALMAAFVILAIGLTKTTTERPDGKTALVAASDNAKEECVSSWALLGMLRECFRRGKSERRKDEE